MKTMSFECEIITPMFMAGANSTMPELRPPSIKGLMRFWWRALSGHMLLAELRDEEANIFGTSDDKIGRSKFSIKIDQKNLKTSAFSPVPHSEKKFTFNGFIPGQVFSLFLITPDNFFQIHDIFKLTAFLGGFGKRSRRGFGSVKILKVDGSDFIFDYSLDPICNLLNAVVPKGFTVNGNKIERNISAHNKSDYPYIEEIEIGSGCKKYEELLKVIGRSSHKNDCDQTGFVDMDRKKRFSSPMLCSVIKDKDIYKPIITKLNAAFEDNNYPREKPDKSATFVSDILTEAAGGCK